MQPLVYDRNGHHKMTLDRTVRVDTLSFVGSCPSGVDTPTDPVAPTCSWTTLRWPAIPTSSQSADGAQPRAPARRTPSG